MLAPLPAKQVDTAVLQDLRNDEVHNPCPSKYAYTNTRLFSESSFSVECVGEKILRAKEKNGRYQIVIKKGSHIGEIVGKSPVYAE